MFLSDQQKANKAQSSNVNLLDLAANAIKEWDGVMSIRDEYTAKFLQESGQSDSPILPNVQQSSQKSPGIPKSQSRRQPMLYFGPNGEVNDPKPPGRVLSPFFLYKEDNFAQLRKDNPDAKATDITKMLARNWASIDQQTKSYYEAKKREEEELYDQDMKLFEITYGNSPVPLFGSGR